jgi:hypothetical protein
LTSATTSRRRYSSRNPPQICALVQVGRLALSADEVRYRVRLGNWEQREIAFKWEQGHWKLARIDLRAKRDTAATLGQKLAPSTKASAPKGAAAPAKRKKSRTPRRENV